MHYSEYLYHYNIFQQNIDEIFKSLLNIFGIVDDVLIVGYADGIDHDKTLR